MPYHQTGACITWSGGGGKNKAASVSQNALPQQLFPLKPLLPSSEASLQYGTELCFPFLEIPIVQLITCCYLLVRKNLQSVCLTVVRGLNPLQQNQTWSDTKIRLSHTVSQRHNQGTDIKEDWWYCKCWSYSQESHWDW